MRLGKDVPCFVCKKSTYISPKRLLKTKVICCSRDCSDSLVGARLRKRIEVSCYICSKPIFMKTSQNKRVLYPSCSDICKNQVKSIVNRGKSNPNSNKFNELESFFNQRAMECNRRAKLKGIEGNITHRDLLDIYEKQKGLCFYSDLTMDIKTRIRSFDSLSVDRVDSNIGYIKDNIVLCCLSINTMKSNHSLTDLQKVFSAIHLRGIKNLKTKIKINQSFKEKVKDNTFENTGSDLYVNNVEDYGNYIKVFTGVSVQPPIGYYFDLVPRSSIFKKGLTLYNNTGIIDQSYTGEIIAIFLKTNDFTELPAIGERVCQLILRQVVLAEFVEESFDETIRNNCGFGSSGN